MVDENMRATTMNTVGRILAATAFTFGLAWVALPQFTTSTMAQSTSTRPVRGAPGPLIGAGLPVVAIGFGVYWLVRRKRRRPE
jgi:hypothetical protein